MGIEAGLNNGRGSAKLGTCKAKWAKWDRGRAKCGRCMAHLGTCRAKWVYAWLYLVDAGLNEVHAGLN